MPAGWLLAARQDVAARKAIVGVSVTVLLAVLGFFKYYGFFVSSFAGLLEAFGLERDLLLLHVVLPVGISFFIFHAISYIVDVYRGDAPARALAGRRAALHVVLPAAGRRTDRARGAFPAAAQIAAAPDAARARHRPDALRSSACSRRW